MLQQEDMNYSKSFKVLVILGLLNKTPGFLPVLYFYSFVAWVPK